MPGAMSGEPACLKTIVLPLMDGLYDDAWTTRLINDNLLNRNGGGDKLPRGIRS